MPEHSGDVEVQGASVVRNGKALATLVVQPKVPYTPMTPYYVCREANGTAEPLYSGVTALEAKTIGGYWLDGYAAGYDEGYAACMENIRKAAEAFVCDE